MDKITEFAALRAAQSACLRPGLVTNCMLNAQALRELCKSGRLFSERTDGGLFLLAHGDLDRFYFSLTDPKTAPRLALPEGTVCEYPFAGAPALPEDWFAALGFCRVLTRERRTRPAGDAPAGLPPCEEISAQAASRAIPAASRPFQN